ncbi:MAG: DUF5591 domain-containing protein [Candidatus Methanoplasma sp.]|jgi:archaeosine synthase|nr:DUF5591 domain-containing protein [Candidatus Methanoplasma sp.]
MLDVIGRSQRGRICEYRKNDLTIRTPAVIRSSEEPLDDPIYIRSNGSSRILNVMGSEVQLDPQLLTPVSSRIAVEPVTKDGICILRLPTAEVISVPDDAEIIVVPNGFELRKDPRKLVDSVIRIREAIGYGRVFCMLGIAEPSTIAILSYMGVDLFDDSLAKAAGINGLSLIPEGEISVGKDVSQENVEELFREVKKIDTFTTAGRLRELVDQRAPSSPSSVAILRLFDNVGYAYQEEACSTVGGRFTCNTTQALKRPDLKRYRETVKERYIKPPHKRILVLLPCSAKKPYHISKTHKAFSSAIHTAQHDTLVHEVIVTSPLGAVPRELDVFYPASSYDIPVTGEWKCEERAMIREMIGGIIAQGYDKIICHLGEDIELVEGLAEMEETVVGDPTSPASLQNLDSALRRAAKGMQTVDYGVDRTGLVRSMVAFQFGTEAADILMDANTYAIGKFPYWKIIRENPENRKEKIQLGMLTAERGMVSLTIEGAEVLAGKYNTVEMTDFEMKGNLFAVGVVSADPKIRIGDEAIVTLNGKVKGVGVAAMSGKEMLDLKRGIAVKIRHKPK